MKKLTIGLASILVLLGAISCTPQTPLTRIERSPQLYQQQSKKHQEKIQQGEIEKGMDMAAVELAWGVPSLRVQTFKDDMMMERWDYQSDQPVFVNSFGFSSYSYHGNGYTSTPLSTQIAYVPHKYASVWFTQGKVKTWEKIK